MPIVKLLELFKNIQTNKSFYSNSSNGNEFEQRFKNKLKAYGFSEIVQRSKTKSAIIELSELKKINKLEVEKIFKKIRKEILLKNPNKIVKNPFLKIKNTFIFQPYSSQNFPDFIIFTNEYIIPIEIKYSKNNNGKKNIHSARPMWNSNIPKPNAIYVYDVSNNITTFFLGSNILDYDTRQVLLNYFKSMDKNEEKLDKKIKNLKNNFGIYPSY